MAAKINLQESTSFEPVKDECKSCGESFLNGDHDLDKQPVHEFDPVDGWRDLK